MASPGRRVLVIVQNLPVPFDRRVWLESTTLVNNGYDVSIVSPKLKGFNKTSETLEGVDIYRYAMPFDPTTRIGFFAEFAWAFAMTSLLSLWVAVGGKGFDVIHACNPPETYWLLGRFWKLFGKRFIFDHHDLSPEMFRAKFGEGSRWLARGLLMLERMTFETADVVIATNESHKTVAVERGAVDPESVFVVRSGPDMKRFNRYDPDLKWSKGKPHLVAYLGDISPQDGLDGLVRIVRELSQLRSDFHCVIIGGGSGWQDVKNLAETMGVADLITFTGVVSDEDLCRILSSATVGVDTVPKNEWSNKSTMNKIVEYMFFGLPIVSYDLDETVHSAGEALVAVPAGNEEGFATALSDLLDSDQRIGMMAGFARRRLETELAWEHSVPHLLAAYERALGSTEPAVEVGNG